MIVKTKTRLSADEEFELYLSAFSTSPSEPSTRPSRLTGVWSRTKVQLRASITRSIVFALIGLALGWLANVLLMAGRIGGYQGTSKTMATGRGNVVVGSAFWFLFSTLVFAVAGYRLKVGKQKFRDSLRSFPSNFWSLTSSGGSQAAFHFLVAFGGALLLGAVVGQSLMTVLGIWLIAGAVGPLSGIVRSIISVVWQSTVAKLSRSGERKSSPPPGVAAVAGLATAAAALFAQIASGNTSRIIIAAISVAAGILLSRRMVSRQVAITGIFITFLLLLVSPALADDGGWSECEGGWPTGCDGAGVVLGLGLVGGAAAAAGAAVGGALGGSLDGGGEDDDGDLFNDDDYG